MATNHKADPRDHRERARQERTRQAARKGREQAARARKRIRAAAQESRAGREQAARARKRIRAAAQESRIEVISEDLIAGYDALMSQPGPVILVAGMAIGALVAVIVGRKAYEERGEHGILGGILGGLGMGYMGGRVAAFKRDPAKSPKTYSTDAPPKFCVDPGCHFVDCKGPTDPGHRRGQS